MPHAHRAFPLALLVSLWLVAPSVVAAQVAPTPRAAGFAGAYLALARGSEAVEWNPANLALPGQPRWSVSVPNLAVTGAVLGPSLLDLRTLTRSDLTDADRQAFLDEIPNGLTIRGDIQVPWVGASIGRFAFGVSTTALLGVQAGREMVDLYLDARQHGGVDPQRLDEYRVGDTRFQGAVLTSAAVAYAQPLNAFVFPVGVGVTGRLVFGHDLQQGRIYDPVVDPVDEDLRVMMLAMETSRGVGFGLDVGVAAQPLPGLTVGAAVENLVQSMSWGGDIMLRGGEFTGTELAEMGVGDFNDRFEPRPYDPASDPPEAASLESALFTGASLPRLVRVGAAYRAGGTTLSATASDAAGGGELHTGWPRYVAVGVGQRLLPGWHVRGGLASSLAGATAIGLGTSISMGAAQLTLGALRTSGSAADAPPAGGVDFPGRLAAASGYALMLGLDISTEPLPPRRRPRR